MVVDLATRLGSYTGSAIVFFSNGSQRQVRLDCFVLPSAIVAPEAIQFGETRATQTQNKKITLTLPVEKGADAPPIDVKTTSEMISVTETQTPILSRFVRR